MQFLLAVTDAFFAGGTIGNALRVALGIFSGKIIYNFANLENLRIFQICLFTGGVWNELPQSKLDCFASSLWEGASGAPGHLLIAPNTLATSLRPWLPLRGQTSPAPGEDVTIGDKKGNLARERLRGFVFSVFYFCLFTHG